MCEPSVFPIFVENDPSKVDKILGLMFFKANKTLKDSKHQLILQTVRQSSLLHFSGLISLLGLTLSL